MNAHNGKSLFTQQFFIDTYLLRGCCRCKAEGAKAYFPYFESPTTQQMRYPMGRYLMFKIQPAIRQVFQEELPYYVQLSLYL